MFADMSEIMECNQRHAETFYNSQSTADNGTYNVLWNDGGICFFGLNKSLRILCPRLYNGKSEKKTDQ